MNNNTDIKPIDLFSNIDTDPGRLDHIMTVSKMRGAGDFNNMLPVVEIQIPNSVLISCPTARQTLIQAKGCAACDHFNGIVQTSFNDESEMQWDHKFSISCAFPVDRKCASMSLFEG